MSARLYYIIGPSGAGKDTLIAYVRRVLPAEAPVMFAHRYITRPADAGGENHVALTVGEFSRMRDRDQFALHWESHGLHYGLGREIDLWLAAGLHVVMNGSRGHLPTAARRYADSLRPVLVEVSPGVLRQRLERRGRESAPEIEKRVARAAAFTVFHPRLLRVSNDGPVHQAGEAFLQELGPVLAQPDRLAAS